jgi:CubicO group peptidase (beta-lactamase class C family)
MRKIFGLILFLLSSLQQAGAQTLSSPKTIYENIERIAVKKEIVASNQPRALVFSESSPSVRQMATEHLNSKETVALMLIDKGQIVYEGYAKSTSKVSRFVSMSMAKSLVALSVGEALCAKKINSLDDTAETYAPELKGLALGKAKIKDILKMSSGVKTPPNFHGDPYDKATDDLLFRRSNMLNIINKYNNNDFAGLFGNTWSYSNMDTDALIYIVKGATGMSFGDWFQATIAARAALADQSFWALDTNNIEIAHSFYFATMQDWARIALFIRDIQKQPDDSCMKKYVQQATKFQMPARAPEFKNYGYQFFVNNTTTLMDDFWMAGYAGQRIGFNLSEDKIILNFSWIGNPEKTYALFRQWTKN